MRTIDNQTVQRLMPKGVTRARTGILLMTMICVACATRPAYRFINERLPGTEPQPFFDASFVPAHYYPQFISFSKDGTDLYLATSDANWKYKTILHSKFNNRAWTPFDTAAFTKRGIDDGEPFVYNNTVYFVSFRQSSATRHTDIYRADKNTKSAHGVVHLPAAINSPANEWHPSFTNNGAMYFASERNNERFQADIYKSSLVNGQFEEPLKLSDSINSVYNDGDPLIAPDEKFLIFHSERPGGFGGHDLYISFRKKDGSWTRAKNMGPNINSSALEFGPSLSPDGRYLFFTRRNDFQTKESSVIYWVSGGVIEALKGDQP